MLGNGVCCGLSVVITYGLSRIGVVRGIYVGSMYVRSVLILSW